MTATDTFSETAPTIETALVIDPRPAAPSDSSTTFRRAFLGFAAVTVVGSSIELASYRHWKGDQWLAWLFVVLLGVATTLTAIGPDRLRLMIARALAALTAVGGMWGAVGHVKSNYSSGPLNYRYTDRWPTMSFAAKLWAATSKSTGAAPSLVPFVLAQGAAFVVLASLHHPRLLPDGRLINDELR